MKIVRKTALMLAMGSLIVTQSGCFGEFALTRKVYTFHDGLTDSKFLKTLLYWVPGGLVYGVALGLDAVILNLIEFWSGSNPISMNEGDHEMRLATINGVDYRIEATKDTFTTTQLSGEKAGEVRVMRFDRGTRTWRYSDSRVCDHPVMTFLDDQAVNIRLHTDGGDIDMPSAILEDRDLLLAKLGECGLDARASLR